MERLKGAILPVAIIVFWWAGSCLRIYNEYIIPPPQRVIGTALVLVENGLLFRHLIVSLGRVLAGFSLTFALAFPLAILVGLHPRILKYIEPALEFIRHIPPIALIPILILWLGIGEASKLSVILLATFFPIFMNTLNGIVNCDMNLVEVGEVYGFSRRDKLLKIVLPQALPSIIVGMQLGIGYSWRSLMGAELIAASSGIGYMIIEAEQLSRPDIIIVGILTMGIVGCLADYCFLKITGTINYWNRKKGFNGWSNNKGIV